MGLLARTKISIGFAAALLTLLILGAASYRATEDFVESSEVMAGSQAILEKLADLRSRLEGAEAVSRGYVITGRP
ncbi:MAG: hypothetical protein QG597_376, partial [Actinomycetota bacterium]|nr:hypothetical protein [Actinomycetota bacterium]